MRYVIDLDSPNMDILIIELSARAITIYQQERNFTRTYGRTHAFTLAAARLRMKLDTILETLRTSQRMATPERAVENPDVTITPTATCDVDDIHFVAGRSRSDPRYPRKQVK